MPKFIDRTGQRFVRLVVVSRGPNHVWPGSRATPSWNCRCDCGVEINVLACHLATGRTKSCGCLNHESLVERSTKHGMYGTPTYKTWQSMLQRCTNPKTSAYPEYGGRGILVCDRWKDFQNFLADMGERPKRRTIDRYPDNDGNYEPGNCRWATAQMQARNKRGVPKVEVGGCMVTMIEASELTGIDYAVIQSRVRRGKRGSDVFSSVKPRQRQGVSAP